MGREGQLQRKETKTYEKDVVYLGNLRCNAKKLKLTAPITAMKPASELQRKETKTFSLTDATRP